MDIDDRHGLDGGELTFWFLLSVMVGPVLWFFPVLGAVVVGGAVLVLVVLTIAEQLSDLDSWWNKREPVRKNQALREIERLKQNALAELRRLDRDR